MKTQKTAHKSYFFVKLAHKSEGGGGSSRKKHVFYAFPYFVSNFFATGLDINYKITISTVIDIFQGGLDADWSTGTKSVVI